MCSTCSGISTPAPNAPTLPSRWRRLAQLGVLFVAVGLTVRLLPQAQQAYAEHLRARCLPTAALVAESVEMLAADGITLTPALCAELITPLLATDDRLAAVRLQRTDGTPLYTAGRRGASVPSWTGTAPPEVATTAIAPLHELARLQGDIAGQIRDAVDAAALSRRVGLYLQQRDTLALARAQQRRYPQLVEACAAMDEASLHLEHDDLTSLTRAADRADAAYDLLSLALAQRRTAVAPVAFAARPAALAAGAPTVHSVLGRALPAAAFVCATLPLYAPSTDPTLIAPCGVAEVIFYDLWAERAAALIPACLPGLGLLLLALLIGLPARRKRG